MMFLRIISLIQKRIALGTRAHIKDSFQDFTELFCFNATVSFLRDKCSLRKTDTASAF